MASATSQISVKEFDCIRNMYLEELGELRLRYIPLFADCLKRGEEREQLTSEKNN